MSREQIIFYSKTSSEFRLYDLQGVGDLCRKKTTLRDPQGNSFRKLNETDEEGGEKKKQGMHGLNFKIPSL